jgi:hypothetical protein
MLRVMLMALALCGLCATTALADDFKATIKKIDAEHNSITVLVVNGVEKTFPVSKDADIYAIGKGKKNKPGPKQPISGGLGGLKTDTEVTVTTIKSNDREVVAAIKIEGAQKK